MLCMYVFISRKFSIEDTVKQWFIAVSPLEAMCHKPKGSTWNNNTANYGGYAV